MKQILWGLAFMIVVPVMFGAILAVPFLIAKGFGIDVVLLIAAMLFMGYFFAMGITFGPGLETWLLQKLKDWRAKAN